MLFFPDEFFLEEEKYGYKIPIKLKHIWAEELEMISEVDRICKKYDIKYFPAIILVDTPSTTRARA